MRPGEPECPGPEADRWLMRLQSLDCTPVDPKAAAGWTEGRLVFQALPLTRVLEELNRYTTRKVRLADPSLTGIRVSGVFDAGDTDSVLAALQYAYPVAVDRQAPGEIVLRALSPRSGAPVPLRS